MATEQELERILRHLLKAVAHMTHCDGEDDLDDTVSRLRKKIRTLRKQREELLLKEARKESTLQYQWSWWAYPKDRKQLPCLASCSPRWYDYQIDAVTSACKDPCLKRSREVFYVCQLRTRSAEPDVAGPLSLYDCMAPWEGNGQLPMVGMQVHPVSKEESSTVQDAIYEARKKFEGCEWDGPSGIQFILFETRGF